MPSLSETGGTVNVDAISSVGSLAFNVGGYTINNGYLTLTGAGGYVNTGSNSATITSQITSTVGLTKQGSGTLTLAPDQAIVGKNAISGTTTVNEGTLAMGESVGYNSTLGGPVVVNSGATLQWNAIDQLADSATVTVNGGTLKLQNKSDYISTLSLNNATVSGDSGSYLIVNGGSGTTIATSGGTSTIGSGIAICSQYGANTGARTQEFATADGTSLDVTGVISDYTGGAAYTGNIKKTGAGNLTLSNTNTFTGTTTIDGGTLTIGGTVFHGTTLQNTVQINAGGTLLYGRTDGIGNGVAVNVNGGTMNLASYSDYTGTVSLSNGGKIQGDGTVWSGAADDYSGNFLFVNGANGLINASGTGNTVSSRIAVTSQWVAPGDRTQEFNVADGGDSDHLGRNRRYRVPRRCTHRQRPENRRRNARLERQEFLYRARPPSTPVRWSLAATCTTARS